MGESARLILTGVTKRFAQPDGDVEVLRGVDFRLAAGHSAAILGESGSGKSTLLYLIAGLDRPDSGDIRFEGRLVSGFSETEWNEVRRNELSIVFQQYHLISTLTVDDNIHLQARLSGRVDADLSKRLIDRLGLSPLLRRLPHQLSGGQQQRVAIARALAHRPRLVLADEPTGNLDEQASESVMALFTQLVRETGSSLLLVTHSRAMAAHLDARWWLRDGRLKVEET